MKAKLTDSFIRNVKVPATGRVMITDELQPGLQLRVTDKGAISFSVVGRGPDGRITRRTLGRYPAVSLKAAREGARKQSQAIKDGQDLRREAAERLAAERAEEIDRITVGDAVARYMSECVRPNEHLSDGYRQNIQIHLRKAVDEMGVKGLPLLDIGRRDLLKLIETHRGRNATARHRLGDMSRFLDWCVEQELIRENPAHAISTRQRPKAPTARSRVLTREEIKAIWVAAGEVGGLIGDYVRFWLLVPARRGEISGMTWEHVDLANRRWEQPGKLTKNNEPHAFHLTDEAIRILERREQATGGGGLVFASERSGGEIKGWSQIKLKLQKLTGTEGWTWHDMRRTFVSELAEADCDIDLLDGILNHRQAASRGGVLGVYQRSTRWPAKIEAMETWSGIVGRMVAPEALAAPQADLA
jgi:integrase